MPRSQRTYAPREFNKDGSKVFRDYIRLHKIGIRILRGGNNG